MPPVTTVVVSQAESGQKLLQFLERRIALEGADEVPRSAIQRWIRTGQVRVDGGRKKPFDRILAGQKVRIPPYGNERGQDAPPSPDAARKAASSPNIRADLNIIHEDAELLVIAKPAGLPAHGGTGHDDSVASRLAARYAHADFRPALIHRLDKNTSGLLLAARTYTALRRLNDLVAKGGMGKHYLAWVQGIWPHKEPTLLEDRLEKLGTPGAEKMTTASDTSSGKAARCRVTPVLVRGEATLLSIQLITGRTHQIRVQLASRGHAIIGDAKYGRPAKPGMLLHAYRVDFEGQRHTLPPSWPAPYAVDELFRNGFCIS